MYNTAKFSVSEEISLHRTNQNFYTHTSKKRGIYMYCLSSVHPSVRLSIRPSTGNQYFLSYFSQQTCITATLNLVWCFDLGVLRITYQMQVCKLSSPVLQISLFSVALFSATMHYSHSNLGIVHWLGVLHVVYQIQV